MEWGTAVEFFSRGPGVMDVLKIVLQNTITTKFFIQRWIVFVRAKQGK
jgi:hypothetical protein